MSSVLKKLRSLAFMGLALFMMSYIFFIGIKNIFRYNVFKHEFSVILSEIEIQRFAQQKYRDQLDHMESSLYWDLQVRRKLGYTKDGEKVFKFIYKFN